jgi:hypothetical protein
LVAVVSLGTGLLLLALIGSLVSGGEQSGNHLLVKGVIIWTTNAITFNLWFWNVDRGGQARRPERNPPPPDFLFRSGPLLAWPNLVGVRGFSTTCMYVAATNAIAFSPTTRCRSRVWPSSSCSGKTSFRSAPWCWSSLVQ